jgi:hypothetical protein
LLDISLHAWKRKNKTEEREKRRKGERKNNEKQNKVTFLRVTTKQET